MGHGMPLTSKKQFPSLSTGQAVLEVVGRRVPEGVDRVGRDGLGGVHEFPDLLRVADDPVGEPGVRGVRRRVDRARVRRKGFEVHDEVEETEDMVHELAVLPVARDPAEKVLVPVDVVVECFDAVVVEVADAFVQRLIEGFLEVCSELAVDGVIQEVPKLLDYVARGFPGVHALSVSVRYAIGSGCS